MADRRRGGQRPIHDPTGQAEVRLFFEPPDRPIGYAAVGRVPWDFGNGPESVFLLHYFGVHSCVRQEVGVERLARCGRWIMGGVYELAMLQHDCRFFALYVDPANPAVSFYQEFGFAAVDEVREGDRVWLRMVVPIPR